MKKNYKSHKISQKRAAKPELKQRLSSVRILVTQKVTEGSYAQDITTKN